MRDTIFFDRKFLDELRHIVSMSPNCDRDSSDVRNNMFRLKELGNNKEPFLYHDLRYPDMDYKNPKNNLGEYYQMKICQ